MKKEEGRYLVIGIVVIIVISSIIIVGSKESDNLIGEAKRVNNICSNLESCNIIINLSTNLNNLVTKQDADITELRNEISQINPSSSMKIVDANGNEVGVFNFRSGGDGASKEVVVFDTNIQKFMLYDWYTGNAPTQGVSGGNRQINPLGSYDFFYETKDCTGTTYAEPWSNNPYLIFSYGSDIYTKYYTISSYDNINIASSDMLLSKWSVAITNTPDCELVNEPKNGKTIVEQIDLPSYLGPLRIVIE